MKQQMKMKALLAAAMAAFSAAAGASAGIIGEAVGDATGIASSPLSATSLSFIASSASTAVANQKRQAYLAAAGQAANFVQVAGDTAVSPLLREVMETEKEIVARARGRKTAALLNDMHLAQMVVFRAEEFKSE